MSNNRILANGGLRSRILAIVSELIINESIKTPTVVSKLKGGRHMDISNRRIGRMLAEVPFLEAEGDGVFRRVR